MSTPPKLQYMAHFIFTFLLLRGGEGRGREGREGKGGERRGGRGREGEGALDVSASSF